MENTPDHESISEEPIKSDNEQVSKPFSWLNVFTALLYVFTATVISIPILAVFAFMSAMAPSQNDFDHAAEKTKELNKRMDDFEQSLQPIKERIETLEDQFSETGADP